MSTERIIIIENNEPTFNKLKEFIGNSGSYDIPIEYNEITDAIHQENGSSISKLINSKIKEYGSEISAFIIDLQLSDGISYGGIDATQQIRRKPDEVPYWRSIVPIIVYTQYPNRKKQALEAGASTVIKKFSKLEDGQKLIELKNSWKQKLDDHFSDTLLPQIKMYCEWYSDAMEKIRLSPLKLKEAVINFFISCRNKPEIKHAFIMTSFASDYLGKIKDAAQAMEENYYVEAHIANTEGKIDDAIYAEVQGHMYCCDFGIGVFFDDSSKGCTINPNLSIEVGFMMALEKPICYLKDKKLNTYPIDLAHNHYTEYLNEENDKGLKNMEEALFKWLDDTGTKNGIKKRETRIA